MMPVMQYIHENKDYPVFVHIFPNYVDESTSFELYEDNGENLDYLKDIYSKTQFMCTTSEDGYTTSITPDDKGFIQSQKRNIVLKYHLDKKPETVTVNGIVIKNVVEQSISETLNKDIISTEWSWNEVTMECWVKIPDQRNRINIQINN